MICKPSSKEKERMKLILEPTEEILDSVHRILEKVDLFNQSFTMIHIRFGDKHLIENEKNFNVKMLETLKREIRKFTRNKDTEKYLLLADNNSIKQYLVETFPFLKTHFKEITHFGEGISLDREKTKNTMVDFHLMSYAKEIVNYSTYMHGSGFSKWCARTYNIPYMNKFIG